MMKRLWAFLLSAALLLGLGACAGQQAPANTVAETTPSAGETPAETAEPAPEPGTDPEPETPPAEAEEPEAPAESEAPSEAEATEEPEAPAESGEPVGTEASTETETPEEIEEPGEGGSGDTEPEEPAPSAAVEGTFTSAYGDMLILEDGYFYHYDSTDWNEMTWARDGYLVPEAGAVTMYEVDPAGERPDEVYGNFDPSQTEPLTVFLVEKQESVDYWPFDPFAGPELFTDLEGTYVSVRGEVCSFGEGYFYYRDAADWTKVSYMMDGYLTATPGSVEMFVSDPKGESEDEEYGAITLLTPEVVTIEIPRGSVPVVFVRDEREPPEAPTVAGLWVLYTDPEGTDAPAAFDFTKDGFWSAYDYLDHQGYSVRQYGPYSTGRWENTESGADYLGLSLFLEGEDDYLTGADMYYDYNGQLLLTFYNGMTYTKSEG